jgi:hypothetical protein
MAQRKITSVQWPRVWAGEFDYNDVGNDIVVDVQPGFVLLDIGTVVVTAFNGTTPTLSAVDNMTTPNTLIASAAIATAGGVLAIAANKKGLYYPAGGKISFKPVVASGTPTAGKGLIFLQGYVNGRQNERVGTVNPT